MAIYLGLKCQCKPYEVFASGRKSYKNWYASRMHGCRGEKERERERQRQTDTVTDSQRQRQTDRENSNSKIMNLYIFPLAN